MNSNLRQIISEIETFEPTEEGWLGLDELLEKLFALQPELGMHAMLRVFERFPEEDGAGVFWSIVHGLETLPGYEETLVESVKHQPSEFGLLMVNRLLNSNLRHVADIDLLDLLTQVAGDQTQPVTIRNQAQDFVEYQRGK